MTTQLSPYLNFRGNAREAMEFYHSVFGGDLAITTFDDLQSAEDPSEGNLVMHSVLTGATGLSFFGSDVPERMQWTAGNDFSVSLSGDDEAELTGYWNGLSDGADVYQPLTKAVWGDSFGMLTDRFGIRWLVNISGAPA